MDETDALEYQKKDYGWLCGGACSRFGGGDTAVSADREHAARRVQKTGTEQRGGRRRSLDWHRAVWRIFQGSRLRRCGWLCRQWRDAASDL